MPSGSGTPLRCRRYLVWPERDRGQSYLILDASTEDVLTLEENCLFWRLGIQHFYDSFACESQVSIQQDALSLFGLQDDELLDDLSIAASAVLRKRWGDHQENCREASYLAQEVASLFREILSHPTLTLHDKTTAHLLCSNYWLKPIYQELVHASIIQV